MKRSIAMIVVAAAAGLMLAGHAWAAGWSSSSTKSRTGSSGMSKAVDEINSGTKRFVQGTIDLVTLKSLRQGSTAKSSSSHKTRTNYTYQSRSSKKKDTKEPFWASWFKPDPKPKRTETIKDFIGRPRPS
jgi:hypothetical protein